MSVGAIGAVGYPMAGYGTKRTEDNVSENQFIYTLIETESTNRNDHAEKAFRSVAPNAPEKVKTAWMEAAAEVGIDGMGSELIKGRELSHVLFKNS